MNGIEKIIVAFSSGVEAAFGNMLAKNETESLQKNFRVYEFFSFALTTVLFTCTALVMLPFIRIYTRGVIDADYQRPLFGILLVLAEAMYCIRIPYHNVTHAAGHYNQTRNAAFLEAGINIVLSVILVIPFGLIGVAAATLAAMTVRTVHFAVYLSRNILHISTHRFFGRCAVFALAAALAAGCMQCIPFREIQNYLDWVRYGILAFAVCTAATILVTLPVYRRDMQQLLRIVRRTLLHRK